ncbi:MAG: CocE/NonD family hydrolase [Cytophagaceae bacterium]
MNKFIFIFVCLFSVFNGFTQVLTPSNVVDIPMRDGKTLKADVYVPSSCSSCPTILIQTPYNRLLFRGGLPLGFGTNLNSSPYAWVIVDWRGFYGSLGATVTNPKRGEDGYDVIEWIKNQTWSNGKIGTWGPSALGVIQYQTAKEKHPNHTCAVPLVAHPQTSYENYYYGGVLEKSRLEQLDNLGYGLSGTVLANPYYNLFWQTAENLSWYPSEIQIPTLQIGGWYDHNIDKMISWHSACVSSAANNVRNKQWLLVGPWVHGGTGTATVGSPNQGELTYSNAANQSNTKALNFFEYYLLGIDNGWESTSKITYYELGKNQWNYSIENSIEINAYTDLILNKDGVLNKTPSMDYTGFISDPRNPSPTIGGPTLHTSLNQGPYDQQSLLGRSDIIAFTTSALESDFNISGRVKVSLYVQSDQPDADISIRLTDVYPDGRYMLINDAIRRMRFRNGFKASDVSFMASGQVYNVEVILPFTNYTWKEGHKINIIIGANNSIRWDVNLQNGGTMYAAGDTNTANIIIHHSSEFPSKILLPGNTLVLSENEIQSDKAFKIFPNPVSDYLCVHTDILVNSSYYIYNSTGHQVAFGKVENNSFKISVSSLQDGFYFVRLINGKETYTGSFVKQ